MTENNKKSILEYFTLIRGEMRRGLSARLGKSVDVDDVLQDTFLRLDGIPADAVIANPKSYLLRMAGNLAVDNIRAQRTRGRHLVARDEFDAADDAPSPERTTDYRQRLRRLEQAVAELPQRQRQVFLMHKFDGKGHTEIARELGISRSAVEKLVMKALGHCRDRLGDLLD